VPTVSNAPIMMADICFAFFIEILLFLLLTAGIISNGVFTTRLAHKFSKPVEFLKSIAQNSMCSF
jgi:hypothetical protein